MQAPGCPTAPGLVTYQASGTVSVDNVLWRNLGCTVSPETFPVSPATATGDSNAQGGY